MTIDEHPVLSAPRKIKPKPQDVAVIRRKGERRRYVSNHFTTGTIEFKKCKSLLDERSRSCEVVNENQACALPAQKISSSDKERSPRASYEEASFNQDTHHPPHFDSTVCDFSSDSDLTDVPVDIGPSPFYSDNDAPPPSVFRSQKAANARRERETTIALVVKRSKSTKKQSPAKSPYFPSVRHAHQSQFLATLPFPPLSHEHFGLMQEKLAHDPFRLLLATIFLNKTPGLRAMPIFYKLMEKYPTPRSLAAADVADITAIIHELGFQNQRAAKCVNFARTWVKAPPVRGKRYRKLHYPRKGDGRDVQEGEAIDDTDNRVAWEISYLPGLGPYSHDSWRMFCRDALRGNASDWLGTGAVHCDFQPEWKSVLPTDKELRAWMTWMWLKEGWVWNKETGERSQANEELMRLARGGGVVHEQRDHSHLLVRSLEARDIDTVTMEQPAGEFLPCE